jgi:hypothetical protein
MKPTWQMLAAQALADLERRRAAPRAGINGPQPTGPAGGGSGGVQAPGPWEGSTGGFGRENVNRWHSEVQDGPERGQALLSAYANYLKRTGRKHDPILDTQGVSRSGPIGAARMPVPPALGNPTINRSNNERRGLTFIPVTLADGQRLHIYYTPDGHRYAVHLKPLPTRGVG